MAQMVQDQQNFGMILLGIIFSMKKESGFTLIELILYISIVALVLNTMVYFAWNIIGGSVKSNSQQEVFSQARFISERIKYEIRNANGINSVAATSISLAVDPPANNPTIISLSGNKLQIKQGGSSAVDLNSADTAITNVNFVDYTSSDNKTKNIQLSFTISDLTGSSRQEYKVSDITVQSSAEVRSN